MLLGACTAIGPAQVPLDQFDYNQAIARSTNEQMLLNLVRLRYGEVPTFLALTSVLTQYVYSGGVGVEGAWGASESDSSYALGTSADVRYIERPTMTYSPLTGQAFAAQMTAPVPTELVFSLIQSGWPPDQLLVMSIQRINSLQDLGFIPAGPPEETEGEGGLDRAIQLLIELSRREAIEVVTAQADPASRQLEFEAAPDPETKQLIDELKAVVNLSPEHSAFRITRRVVGRGPDEVTVRVRSLLELMGFLCRGVDVPPQHLDESRAVRTHGVGGGDDRRRVPLRIRVQAEPPLDAFVAVKYVDYWFYIPRSDHLSKQAFGLLVYLFQMQAPQVQGAGPLLTVPTG
ncbi:MAG TPA: hypothetical protein VFD43_12605 [Planctomycetota bacterium]|nr:hypothetical protein [Planctomycetota bacterium]